MRELSVTVWAKGSRPKLDKSIRRIFIDYIASKSKAKYDVPPLSIFAEYAYS